MRDEKHIQELLGALEKLWKKYPEQRFGQLLFNYTRIGTRTESMSVGAVKDPFFYADDEILKDVKNALKKR